MSNYKGFSFWWNDLQNKFMLMDGYQVLNTYNTLQGLKCAISLKWSKCD